MDQNSEEQDFTFSHYRQKAIYRERLMDRGLSTLNYEKGAKVAIYTRVSSDMQIEGYSMDAQEGRCREFAKTKGWEVYKIYIDPGHSAKNLERPALQNMLQDAADGKFQIILVHKLDRLSRSLVDMSNLVSQLNEWEIMLSSMSENFDFTVASGRFFFHMLVVFAQWYLENLSAEAVKAKEQMFIEGRHNGKLPFGYLKNEETKKAEIVPHEADLIQQCFEMYLTGEYGDDKLAEFMDKEGVRTRRNRVWSKDSIRFMMRNEFYYGMVAHRNKIRRGAHDPIISKELYDRCQQLRGEKASASRCYTNKAQTRIYLLQRIAKCCACGEPLVIRNMKSQGYYYYREGTRSRGMVCEMNNKSIRMEKADEEVIQLLRNIKLPEDWQEQVNELATAEDKVSEEKKHRNKLLKEMERMKNMYRKGILSEEEIDREYPVMQMELDSIVIPDTGRITQKALMIQNMGIYLDAANLRELRTLLKMVFESIYFDVKKKEMVSFQLHVDFIHLFRLVEWEGWIEEGGIYRRIESK